MVSLLGAGGGELSFSSCCLLQITNTSSSKEEFCEKNNILYLCGGAPQNQIQTSPGGSVFFLQFPFCADHATDVTPTGIGKYTPRLSVSTQYRITSINRSVTVRTNARFLPRVPIGRIQRRSTKIKIRSCCAGTSPSIHTSLTKYYYYLLLYPYD